MLARLAAGDRQPTGIAALQFDLVRLAARCLSAAVLISVVVLCGRSAADTQTSFGDRSGEGTTAFTGLAQSPEANLFTGALSTGISIQVPPGRKHMTPNLQLAYSSSGGPSPYGHGWSLTVGRIERTTRFGVPNCNSEHFDEFVMILPGGASVELIAENPNIPIVYRPRVEQKYLRAEYDRNNDTWKAVDGAGMIYTFGDPEPGMNDHARLKSDGEGPCSFTTAWGLTRSMDANGNTIDTTWVDTSTNGNQLLPDEINYGGNDSMSLAHFYKVDFVWEDNLSHYIPETTGSRPGPVSYRRGVREQIATRLEAIEVHSLKNASTLVREYRIASSQGSGRSYYRPTSITVDDLPPQSFVYSELSADAHSPTAVTLPEPSGGSNERTSMIRYWEDGSQDVERTVMDMNGDGLLDLVDAVKDGFGFWTADWNVYLGWVDAESGGFGFKTNAAAWTRTTVADGHLIRNVYVSGCGGNLCTKTDTLDITGDGVPDHVIAEGDGSWMVHKGEWLPPDAWSPVHRGRFASNGTQWSAPLGVGYIRKTVVDEDSSETRHDLLDMNADGLPDLVLADVDPGKWRVHLNTGSGFDSQYVSFSYSPSYITRTSHEFEGSETEELLADFNGDGLPDRIRNYGWVGEQVPFWNDPDAPCNETSTANPLLLPLFNHQCIFVYWNTGQGFATEPQVSLLPVGARLSFTNRDDETVSDLLDVNGDGLPDWVNGSSSSDNGGWSVVLNIGGDFEPQLYELQDDRWWAFGSARFRPGLTGPIRDAEGHATRIDMIDLNGDGFLDRVEAGVGVDDHWEVKLNLQKTKPTLLDMMHNGLGGTNTIRYEPSSHFEHVGDDDAPDLPFISWVVTGTRLNDGRCVPQDPNADVFDPAENECIDSGNELITMITYEDGLFAYEENPAGGMPLREFRGFGTVTQTDIFDNDTATAFEQGTNKKGSVAAVAYFAGEANLATLMRLEVNVWEEQPFPGNTHRTQMWLKKNHRWNTDMGALGDAHVLHRENADPDVFGNVVRTWTNGNRISGLVCSKTEFIDPGGGDGPRDKPKRMVTWEGASDCNGEPSPAAVLEEKKFYYDHSGYGTVVKGNLTKVESRLIDDNGDTWVATETDYDAYGNIIEVEDAEGRITSTDYNTDSQGAYLYPTQITDPLGHVTTQHFDYRHGKPMVVTDPNGASRVFLYDLAGRIRFQYEPGDTLNSPSVTYNYNFPAFVLPGYGADFSVTEVIRKQSDYTEGRWVKTYFDALGRQRYKEIPRVIDGASSATTVRVDEVEFDPGGNVAKQYLPYEASGSSPGYTSFDYHFNGSPTLIDPLGRVFKTTAPDMTTVISTYHGEMVRSIDAAGQKVETYTDGLGRPVRSETFVTHFWPVLYSTSESVYDGLGRLLAVYQNREDADIAMKTMRYDTLGRKIETVDRDSGTWSYGYDQVGNLLWQNDPKTGQHLQFCYDPADRPTRKCSFATDYAGTHSACNPASCGGDIETFYEYDDPVVANSNGRLTRVIDNSGEMRVTGYDARGRQTGMVRKITVEGTVGEAEYMYQYNETDEVVETTYPDGEVVQMTYDETGQPETLSNSEGYVYADSPKYDVFGRLTWLEKGNGLTDHAGYHGANENNRLQSVQFREGATTKHLQTYTYTVRGQVDVIDDLTAGSGASSNGADYGYYKLGQLFSFNPQASGVPTRTYEYDKWGNITKKGEVTLNYGDPTNASVKPHQVTGVTVAGSGPSVSHDGNGNRRTNVDIGSNADANGTMFYDPEDRLYKITFPFEAGNEDVARIDFHYDDGGQQKARVSYGWLGEVSVSKYYTSSIEVRPDGKTLKSYFFGGQRVATRIVDDSSWQTTPLASLMWESPVEVAMEWAQNPIVVVSLNETAQTAVLSTLGVLFVALFLMPAGRRRRAVVGMRLSRAPALMLVLLFTTGTMPLPLLIQPAQACTGGSCPTPTPTPAENVRYFHYDHLGSPIMISDGDGEVSEHIRYNPYGEVRARFDKNRIAIGEPGPEDIRYEFTGYEAERKTGLLYANARFYDPELGSFTSHDPAAEFWSPYSYVGWDPVNGTDPTGECLWVCLAVVGFAIGFAASAINAAINGASFGEALKAGLIGGAIGAITAPIGGYIVKEALGPLLNGVAGAVGASSGEALAKGILFVGGLGQSAYNATEGNYTGLISIGLSLAAAGFLPKGGEASDGLSTEEQLDIAQGKSSLDAPGSNFGPEASVEFAASMNQGPDKLSLGSVLRSLGGHLAAKGLEYAAQNYASDAFTQRVLYLSASVARVYSGFWSVTIGSYAVTTGLEIVAFASFYGSPGLTIPVGGSVAAFGAYTIGLGVGDFLLGVEDLGFAVFGPSQAVGGAQ